MELTFNKVGKQYEAEFQLSADANLHIEFESAAPVKLYQRTTGSGWDLVSDVKNAVGKATDVDLTSLIYPKFVKVVCVQEPTYATVTTDGEITEIKSQSKEVEVTANGTMDITPDAGFSYLNSVKVKTNVPTSGGGSTSSVEYLDVSGGDFKDHPESKMGLMMASSAIRIQGEGYLNIIPTAYIMTYQEELSIADIKAFKIDMNEMCLLTNKEPNTIKEVLEKSYGKEYLAAIPRITKEQFYNLNA